MKSDKHFERLGRNLYVWGVGISFLFTILTITSMQILVYRFSWGLTARTAINSALLGGALFLLGVFLARRKFKPIRANVKRFQDSSLVQEKNHLAEEVGQAVERYPLHIALVSLVLMACLVIETGALLLLQKDLLGAIVLNYVMMGLSICLASAFLEFFILHRFLDPVRELCYPYLNSQSGLRGVTIRARIITMALFLTVVFVILGWTTAEVYTIYEVRDAMLESSELHATLVGGSFDDMLAAEVSYSAQENLVKTQRLYDDEYVVLLDADGEPISEFVLGDLGPDQIEGSFLEEAKRKAVAEQFATGSVSDESGRMIASFAPTGFYGTRILTVVPLSPFLGDAMKVGYTFLYLSLIIALISAVIAWLTVRSFSRPLSTLVDTAGRAGEGILSQEVEIGSADEVGRLSLAFRDMLLNLTSMIDSSKSTALEVMGEASRTQEIANERMLSLEQIGKSASRFYANARYDSRRLRRITIMTSAITEAIESRVGKRTDLRDSAGHSDAELQGVDPCVADQGHAHAECACLGRQGFGARYGDGSGQAGASLCENEPAAEYGIPRNDDTASLRESVHASDVHEKALDFTVASLDAKRLAEETERINVRLMEKIRESGQSCRGEAVQACPAGCEDEAGPAWEAEVLACAETSRDTAAILLRIMDYLPLVMDVLYEISSIAESNAELATELSDSINDHMRSAQLLDSSCQNLAEMAILLQAQTQEFRTYRDGASE